MNQFLMISRGKKFISKDNFERYHNPDDFGAADLNGDDMLDEEEFTHASFHFRDMHTHDPFKMQELEEEFNEYDTNKDKLIDAIEFNTHHHNAAKLPNVAMTGDDMKLEDFELPDDVLREHVDQAQEEFSYEMLDDL
eukprot:TRINITY_DN28162_c0_g1_i1.p1 TRINITY_DN28162_c0_g1~~TRINITY_DN28162_c0_g1_i1.p1  ORF type:complete len:137 (+),score=31.43 TRINITY_DN28162_c0_g1_i1:1-411(+)